MQVRDSIKLLLALGGLAYLGFYVYGLFMGVFEPGEIPALDVIGLGIVAGLVVMALSGRRHADEAMPPSDPRTRTFRTQRERRGF